MAAAAWCLLLALALCLLTCWSFAAPGAPVLGGLHLYGDLNQDFEDGPPHGAGEFERITGENLTGTIFDDLEALGEAQERGANLLGPPVLPVTGTNVVDEGIQLRLQQQESEQNAPQAPLLRKTPIQAVAQAAANAAVLAADPSAPALKPLPDMLPARVWTPVFEGCSPQFVEARCNYYKPNPRLFVTDINELMYARTLQQGQENLIEPLTLRQTYAQFLSLDVRSKKDPYSRASLTNDIVNGTCVSMERHEPDYVTF